MLALARSIPAADASMKQRRVGEEEVHRRRAARQDARHRRLRPDRPGSRARARARSAWRSSRTTRSSPRARPTRPACRSSTLDELLRAVGLHLRCTCRRCRRPGTCSTPSGWRRCKKGVRIVNTARGELIDEAALADAIESGHVAGAGARRVREGAADRLAAARSCRRSSRRRTSPRRRAKRRSWSASRSRCSVRDYPARRRHPERRQLPVGPARGRSALRPYLHARREARVARRAAGCTARPESIGIRYYGPLDQPARRRDRQRGARRRCCRAFWSTASRRSTPRARRRARHRGRRVAQRAPARLHEHASR